MVLRDRRAELRERYTNPYGESGRFKYPFVSTTGYGFGQSTGPDGPTDYGDHVRKVPLPPARLKIPDLTELHCAVYEFFNGADQLLYAGKTRDPRKRFESHRKSKHSSIWWRFVHHAEVQWFPSEAEALMMEAKIKFEKRALYGERGVWNNY